VELLDAQEKVIGRGELTVTATQLELQAEGEIGT
jgi:hypothetical protein